MKPASSLSASRWLSAEFLVYYAYLSALFLFLLPRVTQVFTDACMRVFDCRRRLRPGWIPGRMLDASDAQWHEFRGSAIELLGGAAAFLALSHAIRFVMRGSRHAHTIRLAFYAATSLAFGVGVFGLRFAFPLALAVMSFTLGSLTAGTRLCPLATWAFSLALMFAIEWRTHWFTFEFVLGPRFAIWDAWPRPMLRWHVLFNMVQLRMISFNMDRHWAVQQRGSGAGGAGASDAREVEAVGAGELATGQRGAMALTQRLAAARGADAADSSPSKPRADPALPPAARSDYAVRERTARPLGDYTLLHFLLYAYYVPLQLAGPTITFNAFISQVRLSRAAHPCARRLTLARDMAHDVRECWTQIRESQRTHSAGDKARYAARLVVAALLLDGLGHFVPVFALTSSRAFASPRAAFSPLDIGCLGYATINFMWLKFLIIWRFFRLWALLDGVETVENMNRCVNNNYTLSAFSWRWRPRGCLLPTHHGRLPRRRVLALVAPVVQPLAGALHLRAAGGQAPARVEHLRGVHVCGAVARHDDAAAGVGVAAGAVLHPRGGQQRRAARPSR